MTPITTTAFLRQRTVCCVWAIVQRGLNRRLLGLDHDEITSSYWVARIKVRLQGKGHPWRQGSAATVWDPDLLNSANAGARLTRFVILQIPRQRSKTKQRNSPWLVRRMLVPPSPCITSEVELFYAVLFLLHYFLGHHPFSPLSNSSSVSCPSSRG